MNNAKSGIVLSLAMVLGGCLLPRMSSVEDSSGDSGGAAGGGSGGDGGAEAGVAEISVDDAESGVGGTAEPSGCYIEGSAYDYDAVNPKNPCEVCAATSETAWTQRPAGSPCGKE